MKDYFLLAQDAFNSQDYQKCIAYCSEAILADSQDYKSWKLCAFSLYYLNNISKAIEYLEYSIEIFEDNDSKVALAEMYRKNNQAQKAINILLDLLPSKNNDLYFNLARSYTDIKDYSNAIKYYKILLDFTPDDPQTLYNLGNISLEIGDFKRALEYYDKSSKLGFNDANINLAYTYNALYEEKKALKIYANIESIYSADPYFYFNYANSLKNNLEFEAAKKMYQKAIALKDDPIFSLNYSYLLLSLGEYQKGFEIYQKRLLFPNNLPIPDTIPIASNINEIQNKNVLIYFEQGFGDNIMFSRFLEDLKGTIKSMQILVQPSLYEYFYNKYGECVKKNFKEVGLFDIAISMLSLPSLLKLKDIDLKPIKKPIRKPIRKIGIYFSGNPDFIYAQDKSIKPEILLKTLKDFEIYSLQIEGIDKKLCEEFNVIDLSKKISNFSDTLRELKKLDLLISIDSAILHLAGMEGIDTIALLHKRYDWRWGRLGQIEFNSKWYPNITCIAQEKANDWKNVMKILKKRLKDV